MGGQGSACPATKVGMAKRQGRQHVAAKQKRVQFTGVAAGKGTRMGAKVGCGGRQAEEAARHVGATSVSWPDSEQRLWPTCSWNPCSASRPIYSWYHQLS